MELLQPDTFDYNQAHQTRYSLHDANTQRQSWVQFDDAGAGRDNRQQEFQNVSL